VAATFAAASLFVLIVGIIEITGTGIHRDVGRGVLAIIVFFFGCYLTRRVIRSVRHR
jgi:hypothetical protein